MIQSAQNAISILDIELEQVVCFHMLQHAIPGPRQAMKELTPVGPIKQDGLLPS